VKTAAFSAKDAQPSEEPSGEAVEATEANSGPSPSNDLAKAPKAEDIPPAVSGENLASVEEAAEETKSDCLLLLISKRRSSCSI